MYKDRKETTHVEVGEEDIHHHIYIYIYIKDNHNVCKHGHKIVLLSTRYDDLRYEKITLTHI